jgi:hypothetical protein
MGTPGYIRGRSGVLGALCSCVECTCSWWDMGLIRCGDDDDMISLHDMGPRGPSVRGRVAGVDVGVVSVGVAVDRMCMLVGYSNESCAHVGVRRGVHEGCKRALPRSMEGDRGTSTEGIDPYPV